MLRSPVTRLATRAVLVSALVLTTAAPASAASVISVTTVSSPLVVTAGMPVAYPVVVRNDGKSTVNHITVIGHVDASFDFVSASPAGACRTDIPVCEFAQVRAGQALPEVTFYFVAPAAVGTSGAGYVFEAEAIVGEGLNDSTPASHDDTFLSDAITTTVLPFNRDFVSAYSIPGVRSFTTGGIDCRRLGLSAGCEPGTAPLGGMNPHGTRVRVPTNAEVRVADLPPNHADVQCPAAIAATCFGWGSSLSVAGGSTVPGGIEVTMRWDKSELPGGMTAGKLRIAHLTSVNSFVQVKNPCTYSSAGAPTNMPCISVAPVKLADGDIQATFFLPSNRVTRGY